MVEAFLISFKTILIQPNLIFVIVKEAVLRHVVLT